MLSRKLSRQLCNDSDICLYHTKCENRAIKVVWITSAYAKYLLRNGN